MSSPTFMLTMLGMLPIESILEMQEEAVTNFKILDTPESREKLLSTTGLLYGRLIMEREGEKKGAEGILKGLEGAAIVAEEIEKSREWGKLNPKNNQS